MTENEKAFRGILRAYLFGAVVLASTVLAHISLRWQ